MPKVTKLNLATTCSGIPGGNWENRSVRDSWNPWGLGVSIVGLFIPIFGLMGLFWPGRVREVRIKIGGLS